MRDGGHWQVIVTQITGVIKYSVSDSVEEKERNRQYMSGQCVKGWQ